MGLGDIGKNLVNEAFGTDVFDSSKRKVPAGGIEASFLNMVKDLNNVADLQGVSGEAGIVDAVKRMGASKQQLFAEHFRTQPLQLRTSILVKLRDVEVRCLLQDLAGFRLARFSLAHLFAQVPRGT